MKNIKTPQINIIKLKLILTMKKYLFCLVIPLVLFLTGCKDNFEEPSIENLHSITTRTDELSAFTEEQQTILNQLIAINDSIANSCEEEVIQDDITRQLSYSGQTLWQVVSSQDALGFRRGWEFGRNSGKGFLGRILSGGIAAVMTSFIYSLQATICYAFGWELILHRPTIDETLNYTAYIFTSEQLNQKVEEFKLFNPEFDVAGKEEELRLAIAHNLLIDSYQDGQLIPSGLADTFFSEEELGYYRSTNYARFYRNIPSFVDGTKDFYITYSIPSNTYENEIVSLYVEGFKGISASTTSEYITKTKNLCMSYINVISDSPTLEEIQESNLSSTIFLLPISLEYWSSRL